MLMAAARICSPQPAAPLDRGGGGPGVANIMSNKSGGVLVRGRNQLLSILFAKMAIFARFENSLKSSS